VSASKFFYVCAGLFLLALSYHLGATTATAQGQTIGAAGFDPYERPIVAIGHGLYEMFDHNEILTLDPVPGTSPIIGISENNIVLENGDVYGKEYGLTGWQYRGNFFGIPVPTLKQSWGQLKARYAPSHAPTSQTPTAR
jgi:hypothetical protein